MGRVSPLSSINMSMGSNLLMLIVLTVSYYQVIWWLIFGYGMWTIINQSNKSDLVRITSIYEIVLIHYNSWIGILNYSYQVVHNLILKCMIFVLIMRLYGSVRLMIQYWTIVNFILMVYIYKSILEIVEYICLTFVNRLDWNTLINISIIDSI